MKYFLDSEFIEYPGFLELISIGIICEDGREYYAVNKDCLVHYADTWVKDNVLSKLPEYSDRDGMIGGKSKKDIKTDLLEFFGNDECEFYGYYSDYDWVVFCWIFGKMIDLPKNFPKFCLDLKQMMVDRGLDSNWKNKNCPEPKNAHHALVDAKWNYRLYKRIISV